MPPSINAGGRFHTIDTIQTPIFSVPESEIRRAISYDSDSVSKLLYEISDNSDSVFSSPESEIDQRWIIRP